MHFKMLYLDWLFNEIYLSKINSTFKKMKKICKHYKFEILGLIITVTFNINYSQNTLP